jgi:hypothetical protein
MAIDTALISFAGSVPLPANRRPTPMQHFHLTADGDGVILWEDSWSVHQAACGIARLSAELQGKE